MPHSPTMHVLQFLQEQARNAGQEAPMNLIMFDMDGTLYRTEASFFASVREFASRHAFPAPDRECLRSFIGQSGSEWRAWLEHLQLGTSTQELASEFDLLEQEYVKTQGELYPGTTDVLRALALDGWKLGVCSNAPPWYPEIILTLSLIHISEPTRLGMIS